MKKILTVLSITLGIILISGCSLSKTDFNDLPQEKQTEIENQIKEKILAPYMEEIMSLAFQNNVNEQDLEKIINQKAEKFKNDLVIFLDENYPNIKFNINEISKIDNSKTASNTKKPKEFKKVVLWEFYEFIKSENEKIKIKVNDVIWKWTEYWDYFVYKAKNEFLFVRLEWENVWKKPTFKWLWNVKLITKDWYEFSSSDTEQNPDNLKDWYGWCIECELNPLWKAEQWIVFDIPKKDLAWAVLRFEDDLVDFEL